LAQPVVFRVMDLATHDIDLTAWVTGREYLDVAAPTVSRSGRPHEDMVFAVAALDDGLMANHLVNWLSPFKERSTVITGERGSFVAEGDMIRYAIPKREPLLVEHERFRDAVEGQGKRDRHVAPGHADGPGGRRGAPVRPGGQYRAGAVGHRLTSHRATPDSVPVVLLPAEPSERPVPGPGEATANHRSAASSLWRGGADHTLSGSCGAVMEPSTPSSLVRYPSLRRSVRSANVHADRGPPTASISY
jgi:predicted dehydrogenase